MTEIPFGGEPHEKFAGLPHVIENARVTLLHGLNVNQGDKMKPTQITASVHFVGAFDPDIRTFDIIMKTKDGTSYNSYLVKGSEGVAVIDTVKAAFQDQFFARIEALTSYDDIKYIVLNHLEPDHSGSVLALLEKAKNARIVISSKAKQIFKALVNRELDVQDVKTGDVLSLGDRTLEFIVTPFLHWPDTMMTYLQEERALFSCDVFGAHHHDERIFADLIGDIEGAVRYYYDCIMRPFGSFVRSALELLKDRDIAIIAPSHGPVHRQDVQKLMEKYRAWSAVAASDKKTVGVFYASCYGNTKRMAEEIVRGLESSPGVAASLHDLETLSFQDCLPLLDKCDAVVVGSPTVNGDAVKPIWDLLAGIAYVESKGKIGAAFGSYAWGGEATKLIQERMNGLKLKTPLEPVRAKLVPSEEELKSCLDFGTELAKAILA